MSLGKSKLNRWNRYTVWKPLGLLVIAGLTPEEWEIIVIDENVSQPDYSTMRVPDLIGISSFTSQADRAYKIAKEFRQKGVPVVMGESPWPVPRPRPPAAPPPFANRSPGNGCAAGQLLPPCSLLARCLSPPLVGVNPALQQARGLRRLLLHLTGNLFKDLHCARTRSASSCGGSGAASGATGCARKLLCSARPICRMRTCCCGAGTLQHQTPPIPSPAIAR